MLFEKTHIRIVTLELDRPVGGSGVSSVDVIVAEIVDTDGASGLGFSYVIGGGGAVVLAAANEQAARFIHGKAAIPPQALWRTIVASFNRTGFGPNLIGLAAIDVAVWDYCAKRQNVPLGIAMGGEPRDIEVYGSSGFTATQSAEQAADMATAHVERGFKLIKPRVKGAVSDKVLLDTIRKRIGSGIDIAIDANEKCDLPGAKRLMSLARDQGVLFVEEPLPAANFDGYRALSTAAVAVAAGEHLQQRRDFVSLMQSRALSVIQPDLAMAGGLTPVLELATIAEAFGVSVSPHFLPGLFVHVGAAASALRWLEEFPLIEPMFVGWPERNAQSSMRPGAAAGHGLVLSDRYAER